MLQCTERLGVKAGLWLTLGVEILEIIGQTPPQSAISAPWWVWMCPKQSSVPWPLLHPQCHSKSDFKKISPQTSALNRAARPSRKDSAAFEN